MNVEMQVSLQRECTYADQLWSQRRKLRYDHLQNFFSYLAGMKFRTANDSCAFLSSYTFLKTGETLTCVFQAHSVYAIAVCVLRENEFRHHVPL